MARESRFTDEQKMEMVVEMLAGKVSIGEVCRKYGISTTYAYRLKDRALEVLRAGIGRPAGKGDAKAEQLKKRIASLEELAGDQALIIRAFKKKKGSWSDPGGADGGEGEHSAPGQGDGGAGVDGGRVGRRPS